MYQDKFEELNCYFNTKVGEQEENITTVFEDLGDIRKAI